MTIEDIKKDLQSQLKGVEKYPSEMATGLAVSLRYAIKLIERLGKPEPTPKPETLKVVIDGINGHIRKYEPNGPMSMLCQIAELLISPPATNGSQAAPAPSQDDKTAPIPNSASDAAIAASMQRREMKRRQEMMHEPAHIDLAAETYRTLLPCYQQIFKTNPMNGIAYPGGLVRGSKVQVINSKGNILKGSAGDFHWSVVGDFAVVVYYRKL